MFAYRMRILLLAAVLCLSIALGAWQPAAANRTAQDAAVQINAAAAYNGYYKYGEWLPVTVDLGNSGSDLQGEVRIAVNTSSGVTVFGAPVELPSAGRKRLVIYVLPNNFSRELKVEFIVQGETLAQEAVKVQPQANVTYMAGLLAPERGALALLNAITLPGQERPKVLVDLTLDSLPERPEALRSFDLLVLNDIDTARITPEQAGALLAWVQEGGHLVIGGGAGAQRTTAGLPEALLPVQPQSVIDVPVEALSALVEFAEGMEIPTSGPFVSARGLSAPGAQVLLGTADFPLITEQTVGGGIVDFVALDLAGTPFNGWPGTTSIWNNLIGERGAYPTNMPFDMSPRQFRANSLFYALSNIPSLDLPSIRGIGLLLGLYILVVGPLNYLFLKRWRRLHLAWLTIPMLTAIFTAATFGIAYTLRGNDLVLNKIAIVQTQPAGSANVTSYLGLFSPRQQSYEVLVDGVSLVSPMTGYDSGVWNATGTTGGEMTFLQGSPSRVRGLTVNQWAMQSFMAESTWQGFGQLSGRLQMENDTLVGTVRNDTNYTLQDVIVAMQSRYVRLGSLQPGQEKEISLGLANLQNERFMSSLSYRIFQEANPTGTMSRADELKANILSSVFENAPWSKMISSSRLPSATAYSGLLVFGWLDQAPPEVQVQGSGLSQLTTALVYTNLGFSIPKSGFISIPPGIIPGAVTDMPVDSGICAGPASLNLRAGTADFSFQIPESIQTEQVSRLKIALWQDIGMQEDLPAVRLYSWAEQKWVSLQGPISGVNVIEDAAQFVDSAGMIKLQIDSQSQNYRCVYVDLGLEAQGAPVEGGE